MFKPKFDIKNFPGCVALHCETPEEAQNFCEYMDSIGRSWSNGQPYQENNEWDVYKENTCYNFNKDTYADIDYYKTYKYTIIECSDFDWTYAFTKADLRSGDVVLRRNGLVEIVIVEHDVLVSQEGFDRLSELSDTLEDTASGISAADREWDIVEVRRPVRRSDCQFSAFESKRGVVVFHRD